jgi:hypothetical protein
MTRILAFSGKKQAGKTSALNFIHGYQLRAHRVIDNFAIKENGALLAQTTRNNEEVFLELDVSRLDDDFTEWASYHMWPYVKKYSFATPLKTIAKELFGVTEEQCHGTDDQKNEKIKHLRWENMPKVYTGKRKKQKKGPMTAREFMQFFGTEVMRKIYDDVWCESLIKSIKAQSSLLAVVDDLRFENEAACIQDNGGKIIRFTRNPHDDNHESEIALDDFDNFDGVIDNQNMSINETNQEIIKLLEQWGWLGDEIKPTEEPEKQTGIQKIRS